MRMPGYPSGVRSQYEVHVHPWPTRYHGPIYTRPEFHFPYVQNPQAVFKPDDFSSFYAQHGIGADAPVTLAPAMSERNQGLLNGLLIGLVVGSGAVYLAMRKR
jgi:hypothetical protein